MRVYVFGNEDVSEDAAALIVAHNLKTHYPMIEFICLKPNADMPFNQGESVVLMDVVAGLKEPTLLQFNDSNHWIKNYRASVHDYDLGFQLNYLRKLKKLGEIQIIGLPMSSDINYSRIHSIMRKLVAQDMQGS